MTKEKNQPQGRLQQFAEKKKQDIIVNVENSSATGIIVKWILGNKISVILSIAIIVLSGQYFLLHSDFLEQRNKQLIEERDAFLKRTTELEVKIKALEDDKSRASELNKKVKTEAESLSASQKRRKILQQIRSLKIKRGIQP